MSPINSLPTHKKPREKLLERGVSALSDAELLAIILRIGTKNKSAIELASAILKKYPLQELPNCHMEQLTAIKGLGTAKACQLLAAFELAKRAYDNSHDLHIHKPEQALLLLNSIKHQTKEHFVAIYLNARHQLITQETISIGHLNASLVHPREVYKPAIEHSAAFILIAHNHPSDNITPSVSDKEITKKLSDSGKLLDIELLDHIIVSPNHWLSMKEAGYL